VIKTIYIWNKGYYRYHYIYFIPWTTPRNSQWVWELVKNQTFGQRDYFNFPIARLSLLSN